MRKFTVGPILLFFLAACGGGGGGGGTPPVTGGGTPTPPPGPTTASVSISISLPTAITNAKTRRPMYISPYTQSVSVVAQQGTQTVQAAFNCNVSAHICQGSINAPIGQDTFTVTLMTGTNGAGKALATGGTTQTISSSGSNTLSVTFNPVIGSVRLRFSQAHWGTPYLSAKGPTSVSIDVLAVDAAGNIIVGPGAFVDAQNNPLTVKISDNGSPHTSVSPATFNSAQPNTNDTTALTLSGSAAPFEQATLDVSVLNASSQPVNGIGTQGLVVPISPYFGNNNGPIVGGFGPSGGPFMTSLYGTYAMQLWSYDPNGNGGAGGYVPQSTCTTDVSNGVFPGPCGPFIEDSSQQQQTPVCCSAAITVPNQDTYNVDHLLGGTSSPSGADKVLWFVVEPDSGAAFGGTLGYADITSNTAHDNVVALGNASPVRAMIADSTGKIWLAQEHSGAPPTVATFDPASPPAHLTDFTLPSDQSGGVVDALIAGKSGTVYAVVSVGSSTHIDTLTAGITLSANANVAVNLRPGTSNYLPIVGYSPSDGNFYAVDSTASAYYQLAASGSAYTITKLTSHVPVITSADPNRLPMSVLPDGSLAFEGSSPLISVDPNPQTGGVDYYYAHIVPGASPVVSVIPPACGGTAACFLYPLWSIVTQGNNVILGTTDGGKSHAVIWL